MIVQFYGSARRVKSQFAIYRIIYKRKSMRHNRPDSWAGVDMRFLRELDVSLLIHFYEIDKKTYRIKVWDLYNALHDDIKISG